MIRKWYALGLTALMLIVSYDATVKAVAEDYDGIIVHYQGDYQTPYIYCWDSTPSATYPAWPGEAMVKDVDSDWYTKEFPEISFINLIFSDHGSPQTGNLSRTTGEWWYLNNRWYDQDPGNIELPDYEKTPLITMHLKSPVPDPKIRYHDVLPNGGASYGALTMTREPNHWYRYTIGPATAASARFTINDVEGPEFDLTAGEWWLKDNVLTSFKPNEDSLGRSDFREETIYFLMTARFYDGDSGNNIHCWDDTKANNPDSDPAWRGDFQGLIDKLDYIKALGFSAIWITPVVENGSGYDYHGYHAIDFSQVDPRLESKGATFQDLIDAAHDKDMKIIQDIVLNHSGNFGEENLFPMFKKDYTQADTVANLMTTDPYKVLPDDYPSLNGDSQYGARINAMKEASNDLRNIYHHEKSMDWEGYSVQTGQIAGDCVDLNTENPYVSRYLIDAYNRYIDMGVDAFRVDTVKHISRLTFNNEFLPAFKARGGDDFFIFGELASRYRQVWNHDMPPISTPFYTWKESKDYPWATLDERAASVEQNFNDNKNSVDQQPTSSNHYLNGNDYRPVDYSRNSGMAMIDFPMHWNFLNAGDAFNVAKGGDHWYNDATTNVTYVDSHDYAPDGAPEGQRFNQSEDVWAENLSLMFTFRGIPTIYYGSEIQFKKGFVIDDGPNRPLSETGRAYFGGHIEGSVTVTDFGKYSNATGEMANTLNHSLAKHIRALNIIRRAVPALQKGQYSTTDVSGGFAYKRRFTSDTVDSFALVTVSGGASFSNLPAGTYVDVVTGDTKTIGANGTINVSMSGKGNVRVYVLTTGKTSAPGDVLDFSGTYIK
jgi:glycosidase